MPINDITQTISELPSAGHRGVDVQTQFVIKQEDFQDHLQGTTVTELNTLKDQLNTRIGEINSTTTTMNGYANTASAGASTATTKAGEASTSASEALTSKNQASTFATNSSNSATKASQWADNNYNVEVETGKYSAKHWSTVAQNATANKVDKVTSTDNAIVRFDGITGQVQNSGVIIDDSGNVGIGGIPSSSLSVYKTLEMNGVVLGGHNNKTNAELYSNAYLDSSAVPRYLANSKATYLSMYQGTYTFSVAPSGTAGNAITWTNAMTLNSNGNLLIGTTTDNGVDKLQVNGSISNVHLYHTISDGSANTGEYTKTAATGAGADIFASVFGDDIPTVGELYAEEIGTSNYLIASVYKRGSAYAPSVTIQASSGLGVTATNNQGTITLNGFTNMNNVRMMSKIRKIY